MYTFNDLQKLVEARLTKLSIIKEPEQLYQPIQYSLDSGGKRIRPSFVLMGCNLFSDSIEQAFPPALAIEVFHNFTLLHDDIMDKAPIRRGKPTVHEKWDSNIAILSGDAMSIKAYELLAEYKGERFVDLIKLFNKTAIQVCEGQQLDMNFEKTSNVSEDEYLGMIELKTAALLAASLNLGALIGGADDEDAQNLYEFGRYLGLSFQLQDDYLDLYGDPEVFGKKIGGDILANKKTYLLIKALQVGTQSDSSKIIRLMKMSDIEPEDKIKQVKQLFDKNNIADYTTEKIQEYNKKAEEHFERIHIAEKRKQPLLEVAQMLMYRNR